MTAPIEHLRTEVDKSNYLGIARIVEIAKKHGERLGMPTEFPSREGERGPEAVDMQLFRKVRRIIIDKQLQTAADRDRSIIYFPSTKKALLDNWDTYLDDVPGPEGLRRVDDNRLLDIPGMPEWAFGNIRDLYPYSQEAAQTEPSKDPVFSPLGEMVRSAREHDYPGVATILTVAWVLAEQQQETHQAINPDLLKTVQQQIVAEQLQATTLPSRFHNRLVQNIATQTLENIFDASELRFVSNEELTDIRVIGLAALTAIRDVFPYEPNGPAR